MEKKTNGKARTISGKIFLRFEHMVVLFERTVHIYAYIYIYMSHW